MLNKCSIELQNALLLIWAHIYNDLFDDSDGLKSTYKNEVD
jgi:hypothetical protein